MKSTLAVSVTLIQHLILPTKLLGRQFVEKTYIEREKGRSGKTITFVHFGFCKEDLLVSFRNK